MQGEEIDTSKGIPVFLNVYNFWSGFNKGCGCIGLGVYHTAIQISYIEYMYYGFDGDESGVIEIEPKSAAYEFSEQILLGYMKYSYFDLEKQILQPLHHEFLGNRYDLFNNNCNHFAFRMAEMLALTEKFPNSKIFRITNFCNYLRCCIPNCILSGRLDWFASSEQEEMQQVLNDRVSHNDRSWRKVSPVNSSKYEEFIEEEDEIQVKEHSKKEKGSTKAPQQNEKN